MHGGIGGSVEGVARGKRVLVRGEGERGRSLSLSGVSQHVYRCFTILSSYYHLVECKVFYYYIILTSVAKQAYPTKR